VALLLDPALLRTQTLRHLQLVAISTVLVIGLAVPLGIVATRPRARRVAPLIIGLGNTAQTVPSFGVLVLCAVVYGIGFGPAVIALVLYAFLSILRNTMVGLRQVDPFVTESARAMGVSSRAVLRRIELPLAVPVIPGGVRTAAVINIGTATIAALINVGGLGEVIYQGITTGRTRAFVVGAILAGVLALLVDHLLRDRRGSAAPSRAVRPPHLAPRTPRTCRPTPIARPLPGRRGGSSGGSRSTRRVCARTMQPWTPAPRRRTPCR
jgi:osmoprotectant transport system permease protein